MSSQKEAIQADAAAALHDLEQASAQLSEALTAVQTCDPATLNQQFLQARARLGLLAQALVRAVVLREMQQYATLDASEDELRRLRNRQPLIEQTHLQSIKEAITR